jgi:alanine dehydrogenase
VPGSVRELVHRGHDVLVETGAGVGIAISDEAYRTAGAQVVSSAQALFASVDLVVKVNEPPAEQDPPSAPGPSAVHLSSSRRGQGSSGRPSAIGAVCIAYETVTDGRGGLPLLAPMSEVAGRMSVQVGAHYLEKEQGGRGVLLGGVPGVPAAKVVVLGGGVAGTNAARMAMGVEA